MKVSGHLSDINPDQIDEGFNEDKDDTIAQAEQVFAIPFGSDKGKKSTCITSTSNL